MATQLLPEPAQPAVLVDGAVLRFIDFVETDPDVVRIIGEADDSESAAHVLLRIGGQAVELASTELDTGLVDRRFAELADTFNTTMSSASASIAGATAQLLDDEHGGLPKIIADTKADLAALLDDTFDTDSKSSVIAKIEQVLSERADQLAASLRVMFTLDQPDSPLA